jgi:hypothetical protein
MKTISPDGTYIDYWQNYGTEQRVLKSHFGIRVWADRCCAITNVAAQTPNQFGETCPMPIAPSEIARRNSVSNVANEHMNHYPGSDLVAVLTGTKPFQDAVATTAPNT